MEEGEAPGDIVSERRMWVLAGWVELLVDMRGRRSNRGRGQLSARSPGGGRIDEWVSRTETVVSQGELPFGYEKEMWVNIQLSIEGRVGQFKKWTKRQDNLDSEEGITCWHILPVLPVRPAQTLLTQPFQCGPWTSVGPHAACCWFKFREAACVRKHKKITKHTVQCSWIFFPCLKVAEYSLTFWPGSLSHHGLQSRYFWVTLIRTISYWQFCLNHPIDFSHQTELITSPPKPSPALYCLPQGVASSTHQVSKPETWRRTVYPTPLASSLINHLKSRPKGIT